MTTAKHPRYRPAPQHVPSPRLPERVKLWLLRMLVLLEGRKELLDHYSFDSRKIGLILNIPEAMIKDKTDRDEKIKLHLVKQLALMEPLAPQFKTPETVERNVQKAAMLIGLSPLEVLLLEFTILLKANDALKMASECVGNLHKSQIAQVLSTILQVPVQDVKQALHPRSKLARSGLMSVVNGRMDTLDDKLKLLSDSLAERLVEYELEPQEWLRDMIMGATPAHLTLDDYSHVDHVLTVLRPYLRQSMLNSQLGVNVFIYGPPGTGKTQLAKLLAQDCDCALFEVTTENDEGDALDGEARVKALCAANSFFAQHKAMLLFDEVEDVFNPHAWDATSDSEKRSPHKGRINRVLETNAIPTIWVSNSARIDPAFLRRFDVVLQLPIPPKSQRERIINSVSQQRLPAPLLSRMAESEHLSAAVVARASKVVLSVHEQYPRTVSPESIELLVSETLQAQGHPKIASTMSHQLPQVYDPAFINTAENLNDIAEQLTVHRTGRLCLYGPPGTGKTAFGRWLATRMDAPLHVKRASDLLDMYVGGSEKNIAHAFAQATQDRAVLLIDEIDSFLQDRQAAQRSWEVTQVNEMLTQIEAFEGVLIASTNLMGQLDAAALRRFDLKLRFDYLRPQQAANLLHRYCEQQQLLAPNARDLEQLEQLQTLTPGDFAAVSRQNRLRPLTSAAQWISALREECAVKPSFSRPIGFMSFSEERRLQ